MFISTRIHLRLYRNLLTCRACQWWGVMILVLFLSAPLDAASTTRPATRTSELPSPTTTFANLLAGKKQTVIVYGTSLTIRGAWTRALRDDLEQRYPDQVNFINAAKAGMNSNWGVDNLPKRVLEAHPDLVFIEFSINDAATKHNISLEKSSANLDAMVSAIKAQNPSADIVLLTMNPAWDSPRVAPKQYASERPDLEAYYDVYRQYAHDHALPLVDLYPIWHKIQQETPERFHQQVPDGIHPSSTVSVSMTWPPIKAMIDQTLERLSQEGRP